MGCEFSYGDLIENETSKKQIGKLITDFIIAEHGSEIAQLIKQNILDEVSKVSCSDRNIIREKLQKNAINSTGDDKKQYYELAAGIHNVKQYQPEQVEIDHGNRDFEISAKTEIGGYHITHSEIIPVKKEGRYDIYRIHLEGKKRQNDYVNYKNNIDFFIKYNNKSRTIILQNESGETFPYDIVGAKRKHVTEGQISSSGKIFHIEGYAIGNNSPVTFKIGREKIKLYLMFDDF